MRVVAWRQILLRSADIISRAFITPLSPETPNSMMISFRHDAPISSDSQMDRADGRMASNFLSRPIIFPHHQFDDRGESDPRRKKISQSTTTVTESFPTRVSNGFLSHDDSLVTSFVLSLCKHTLQVLLTSDRTPHCASAHSCAAGTTNTPGVLFGSRAQLPPPHPDSSPGGISCNDPREGNLCLSNVTKRVH